jgi:RNA polymerase sporulation-specific sigma factor
MITTRPGPISTEGKLYKDVRRRGSAMVTIEEAQANSELMDIFINENMGLVRLALKQLHIPHTDDYIQEGAIGLIKAVKRFDTNYGTAFSTYAIPMIEGEIRKYMRNYGTTVKVPRDIKSLFYKSLRLEHLTDEEICKELNITMEQLNEARMAMITCKSLDEDVHKDDSGDAPISLHSIIPSEYDVEEDATDTIFLDELRSTEVRKFGEKAAKIIDLYLKGLTQCEIGKSIHISQVQVSRILRKIGRVLKPNIEGGIKLKKQKITCEQLLAECREHGTDKTARKLIADKYGMVTGSVSGCIYKYGICNKLKDEKEQPTVTQEKATQVSYANPDVQIIHTNKESESVKQHEDKRIPTLKVKAWDGKENTYSFKDGKLVISNGETSLLVADIKAMIRELQELSDKAV